MRKNFFIKESIKEYNNNILNIDKYNLNVIGVYRNFNKAAHAALDYIGKNFNNNENYSLLKFNKSDKIFIFSTRIVLENKSDFIEIEITIEPTA